MNGMFMNNVTGNDLKSPVKPSSYTICYKTFLPDIFPHNCILYFTKSAGVLKKSWPTVDAAPIPIVVSTFISFSR